MKGGSVIAKDMTKTFYDEKGEIIVQAPLDKQFMLFLLRPEERILPADSKPDNLMDLCHLRMGHPHDGALRRMIKVTTGVQIPTTIPS